ncbi:reticulon-4-interacting protein 1 homolog, mitochondrial-like isoform X2 [Anabrus simplex]|uniref:reticulon-4-interacting protein 1 homolog, mitochondrial-like isoform X2 n=1 Tax=Anabrus simplex TaxID=316456 RepID=UPI0035A36316
MDEVIFHASQRLEALQLHVYSGMQHGRYLLQNYSEQLRDLTSSPSAAQLHERAHQLLQWIQHVGTELRRIATSISNPEEVYTQLLQFLGVDSAGIGIYYGCIGFILGSVIGVSVGLSWQRPSATGLKMKAIVCNSYRGLDSLALVEDAPCPKIRNPDEMLIQVKAASVDLIDVHICSGYGRVLRRHLNKYNPNVKKEFPVILGRDCSGIVVELGRKVNNFEIGDEVWFTVPYWVPGTLAEYVVVKQNSAAKKPKGISFEIAASLPYSGMVAWDAMTCQAGLNIKTTQGKRILVHSGCTPVGCILLQLSHLWGAHVTTTCSLRATPVAQALGADQIIVSDNMDIEKQLEQVERFDVIFNTTDVISYKMCLKFCQPEGIVVTTTPTSISSDTYGIILGCMYSLWMKIVCTLRNCVGASPWSVVQLSPKLLDELGCLVETGSLQPVVDKIFSPQDAELAFHHIDSGETIGKTVIRFRSRILVRNNRHHHRKGRVNKNIY